MTGTDGRNPGGQPSTWHICLVEDVKVFRATEGSTEHCTLVFGVDTAVWTVPANKTGKWYRGALEAAERLIVQWHKDEGDASRKRQASAVGGAQGNGSGGGNSRKDPAVDESWKETTNRRAMYQAD